MDMLFLCLDLSINMDIQMNKRPRFLQEYFCLDFENNFGFLVVIQISEENTPVGSFIVKIPMAHRFYEDSHHYYVTAPN